MRIHPFVKFALVISCTGLLMSAAHAAPQTHDGFYLRLHTGIGSTTIESDTTPKTNIEGAGGGGGLSLGYMVIENTGLFVEFSSSFSNGPDFTDGGMTVASSDSISVGVSGAGFGIVHYFMPLNLYISAAYVADEMLMTESNLTLYQSKTGSGVSVMVGKEWWVSDNWGLGVAAALRTSSMDDDEDSDLSWNASGFNVVFSATYN